MKKYFRTSASQDNISKERKYAGRKPMGKKMDQLLVFSGCRVYLKPVTLQFW